MDIKEDLLLWLASTLTDKTVSGSGANIPSEFKEQLAKELHKPIIRKLKKEKFIPALKIMFGVLI